MSCSLNLVTFHPPNVLGLIPTVLLSTETQTIPTVHFSFQFCYNDLTFFIKLTSLTVDNWLLCSATSTDKRFQV